MKRRKKKRLGPLLESPDGRLYMNGEDVLWLLDTKGISLDIQYDLMKEKDIGFDVCGFIRLALQSPNFSEKKLRSVLRDSTSDPDEREMLTLSVDYVLRTGTGP